MLKLKDKDNFIAFFAINSLFSCHFNHIMSVWKGNNTSS
jgi:hypothetical protein